MRSSLNRAKIITVYVAGFAVMTVPAFVILIVCIATRLIADAHLTLYDKTHHRYHRAKQTPTAFSLPHPRVLTLSDDSAQFMHFGAHC